MTPAPRAVSASLRSMYQTFGGRVRSAASICSRASRFSLFADECCQTADSSLDGWMTIEVKNEGPNLLTDTEWRWLDWRCTSASISTSSVDFRN